MKEIQLPHGYFLEDRGQKHRCWIMHLHEFGITELGQLFYDFSMSGPHDFAAAMNAQRDHAEFERVAEQLADALDDIVNYTGGADTPMQDEYLMERAAAALALWKKLKGV